MAENLDVLLEDDEFGDADGDYDIQDDEENALLDDGNDSLCNKNDLDEGDVLQLDETVEISDDFDKNLSTSNLNEDSDEEKSRNDKFTNEREMIANVCNMPKQQNEAHFRAANNNIYLNKKQVFRGGYQRGRGGRGRGNFVNKLVMHRKMDSKKVLVNPDFFKEKMNMNPNGGNFMWNNRNKGFVFNNNRNPINKPTIPIQPWMQNSNQQNAYQRPHNEVVQQYNSNMYPPTGNNVAPLQVNYQNRNMAVPPRIPNVQHNSHFNENRQVYMRNTNMPMQNIPSNTFTNPMPGNNVPPYQGYNNNVVQFNSPPPVINHQVPQQYSGASPMPPPQNYNNNYQNMPFQTNSVNYNNQGQYVENQRYQQPNYAFQQPQQQQVFNQGFNTANHMNNINLPQQSAEYINHQQRPKQNKPLYQNRTWTQNYNLSPNKRRVDNTIQDIRKKKRPLNVGNLHQVTTISTEELNKSFEIVENHTPTVEEDEETIAYRQKIEEQKKIREKILRQKEERRKQAAKKLQAEEEYNTVAAPIELLKKEDVQKILPINVPKQQNQNQSAKITVNVKNNNNICQTFKQKVVPKNNFAFTNSNNIQIKTIDDKPDLKIDQEHINHFLNNRTIIAKDDNLIDTCIVVVSNLAAGTSEVKLRKLCQGVGDIQKLQLSSKERQATIEFKSVASAHAFYKKYQRYMLDLSMIQVILKN